jgi:hypothetical protein
MTVENSYRSPAGLRHRCCAAASNIYEQSRDRITSTNPIAVFDRHPRSPLLLTSRAREAAHDGGRRRRDASYGVPRDSTPVSTTAMRGLSWHRSLSGARARGQRRACEIDLRGARPAPAACAALCVAMAMVGGGRRRWFVGGDRTAARIRRRAGEDGRNAQRRHQHDTRRHPATSVSFWNGDRRLRSVSLAP